MTKLELSTPMRQALIDLDNPYCDGSAYWVKNTMSALEKRGLVFRRDNGITWSWEVTPEGRKFLQESGTSGCAKCDELKAENAALRDRVEALEWLVECIDNYEWNSNRSGWFVAQGVAKEAKATMQAAREAMK